MNSSELKLIIDNLRESSEGFRYWMNLLGISTLMGGCAAILSEDMRSLKGFLRCTILGMGASYLVGAALQGQSASNYVNVAVGLSALYANYIFIILMKVLKMVIDDPRSLLDAVLDRVFGERKSSSKRNRFKDKD